MEFTVKMSEKEIKEYFNYLESKKKEFDVYVNKTTELNVDEIAERLYKEVSNYKLMGC